MEDVTTKKLLYSWRVKAMLNYLKSMTRDDQCDKKDIEKVIDNYIDFVNETDDAKVLICKAGESNDISGN